ncbi:PEPxxWA-CTERM sorting domain-containing protein [Sandarakinorhabdus sp.]|uniref:PEPxxWA-CTERM sorting domain-containing protein n=1 Tax=Sandarakinorhabdus sp. TaxID=1916663 RepID=UPI003342372B
MKILSKLSLGAVAAGAIAAPSAATTTTVNFFFANNGSGRSDITLGGNTTPQYTYDTSVVFSGKNQAYFVPNSSSSYGVIGPVVGPVALPTPNTATQNLGGYIGYNNNSPGDRYLPLQFSINGTTTVGNAFFNNTNGLVKIEYADVAGGVPEPAIWAELVAGFALAGAAMRRRRPQAAVAA